MINPFKDVNWHPNRAARRAFARSLVIGFPIVGLLFLLVGYLGSGEWSPVLSLRIGVAGLVAGLVFWLVPAIVRPFYVVWYALACTVSFVVSNLLMSAVFYGLFTTIGLLLRVAGRRSITKGPDRSAATYWIDAIPPAEPGRYFRQF
jgi:hypothetical protein